MSMVAMLVAMIVHHLAALEPIIIVVTFGGVVESLVSFEGIKRVSPSFCIKTSRKKNAPSCFAF